MVDCALLLLLVHLVLYYLVSQPLHVVLLLHVVIQLPRREVPQTVFYRCLHEPVSVLESASFLKHLELDFVDFLAPDPGFVVGDHSLSNRKKFFFEQMLVSFIRISRVESVSNRLFLLSVPTHFLRLLFRFVRFTGLFLILRVFEVVVQHVDIVDDPGVQFPQNKLVPTILHLLLQFSKEYRLEDKKQHSLLKDLVFVAESQIKFSTVTAELGPLLSLLVSGCFLEMLILLSNSIDVVFNHDVLASLQGHRVFRR